MQFALGYLAGLAMAIFIVVVLLYFKSPIERFANSAAKGLSNAGPRPRGDIYLPGDEADAVRQKVIADNREQGKDTHISELQ